jgi:Flp pilus assembly pilin Flp
MRTWFSIVKGIITDERGGETLEYSLVVALLVIAGLMIMSRMGVKAVARWTSIERALDI